MVRDLIVKMATVLQILVRHESRPYRQRFNPNAENGDRPQRSYNNDRSYRPRYNGESGDPSSTLLR